MQGKITIDEAYLKLSQIEVSGGLQNERNTNIIQTISADEPPFQLSDSASRELALRIPPAMYDQLTFNLELTPDPYKLVMAAIPGNEPPDQGTGNEGTGGESTGGTDTDTNNDYSGNDDQNGSNAPGDDGNHDDGTSSNENNNDENSSGGQTGDTHHNDDKDKGKHKGKGKDHQGHGGGRTLGREAASTVDLDDFFQNAKPGMVVIATYENNGKTIRLVFAGSGITTLSVPARQGDSPVIIIGEKSAAEITFDPERWFSALTPEDIESAPVQIYQGQPVLFIHRDYNSGLFEELRPRVQESADLNFIGSF